MAAAGEEDRLSALPDDLIRRVLHFVPFKEAASTSALSRRYGSFWRSSGAVNLAVRVHDYTSEEDAAFLSRRNAFVRAAKTALTAAAADAGCHVKRLTFNLEADSAETIKKFLYRDTYWWHGHDVLANLISLPAARGVEELRVGATGYYVGTRYSEGRSYMRIYRLSLASLPSRTLRVLDLTDCCCDHLSPPAAAAAAFPRLATLRLRICLIELKDLQGILDSSPDLATVHLESFLAGTDTEEAGCVRLRCPAVTTLVLANLGSDCFFNSSSSSITIDAPKLRSFTYVGFPRPFSLSSPAPDLAWVDLHFLDDVYHPQNYSIRAPFWQFVKNFTNAKALKIKAHFLRHIATAVGKGRRPMKLPFVFPNVGRLELEGVVSKKKVVEAIGNMLEICPMVRDLTLKLVAVGACRNRKANSRSSLQTRNRSDFDKFVDRLDHRSRSKMAMVFLDDDIQLSSHVSDIPALSERSLACLQNSLRIVRLQFRLDSSNCFGVRLVKFFAKNAKALEEICVEIEECKCT